MKKLFLVALLATGALFASNAVKAAAPTTIEHSQTQTKKWVYSHTVHIYINGAYAYSYDVWVWVA